MTLKVESPGVYTSQGVPISVTGIAQVSTLYCRWSLALILYYSSCCHQIVNKKVVSFALIIRLIIHFFSGVVELGFSFFSGLALLGGVITMIVPIYCRSLARSSNTT